MKLIDYIDDLPKHVEFIDEPVVELSEFRVLDGQLVNGSDFSGFFISDDGVKHIIQIDLSWQSLICSFTDDIINDAGFWRVKTSADILTEQKKSTEQRIEAARNTAMFVKLGSTALGSDHDYSVNPENNNFLNNLITLGNGSKFTCTDSSNVKARRFHAHDQLMTLANDIESHISAQFDIYEAKLGEIALADNQTKLDAVVW